MNKLKTKARILLIIILTVFVVIPFLSILSGKFLGIREGATNMKVNGGGEIELGIEDGNTQIDRVVVGDSTHKYCVGDVSCGSADLIFENLNNKTYTHNNNEVGYTYKNKCSDDTDVSCTGSSLFSGFYGPFNFIPHTLSDDKKSLIISDVEPTPNSEPATANTIKCVADNGAVPGDPLCCGQEGVVQNNKHNCPSEYPYCVGYKCGETWGNCSTTSDSNK